MHSCNIIARNIDSYKKKNQNESTLNYIYILSCINYKIKYDHVKINLPRLMYEVFMRYKFMTNE